MLRHGDINFHIAGTQNQAQAVRGSKLKREVCRPVGDLNNRGLVDGVGVPLARYRRALFDRQEEGRACVAAKARRHCWRCGDGSFSMAATNNGSIRMVRRSGICHHRHMARHLYRGADIIGCGDARNRALCCIAPGARMIGGWQ